MTKETAMKYETAGAGGKNATEAASEGKPKKAPKEQFDPPPLMAAVATYISYALIMIFGYIADILRRLGLKSDRDMVNIKDVSFFLAPFV